ncbi:YlbF family regulator [Jeotgalibaca sp. A127]|uniref:YlbF family regulator n=1 Tax=Jeotgalibaca sp. A127 TaxID=3457324 RepID=UPI003FCF6CB5
MNVNEYHIESDINKELDKLIALLLQKEEIIAFQKAENKVEESKWVQDTIEQIKNKQRDLVNFEYYEKPEAYKKTLDELNALNKAIDENITVQQYRASLVEANEVVQFLFKQIQTEVDSITD